MKSRLIDGFSSGKSFPAIPFTLGDTPQWHVYDDGLDYALIPLRPSFVLQLMAGGVSALGENAWTSVPDSPDAYFLLGFPKQGAEITVTSDGGKGNVNVSLGTPLLPIQPVNDPPDALKRGAERFYASVPIKTGNAGGKTITLTDIEGMSGGPIFAVQRAGNHRFRYWVVAVQSGWTERSRVLLLVLFNRSWMQLRNVSTPTLMILRSMKSKQIRCDMEHNPTHLPQPAIRWVLNGNSHGGSPVMPAVRPLGLALLVGP